jgi:CDGSH-type Zn-finger protein/uncharacterized Fe-S cluster protein YjdI
MTEKYTGIDRPYTGDDITIRYNIKRCIHAQACVRNLPAVFDRDKRPWINANGAPVDHEVTVIEMCPSGALHYERKDGLTEPAPSVNVITVRHNGPLEIHGDLSIQGTTVDLQHETRASLCRCGASENKPFCDNTHRSLPFEAVEIEPVGTSSEQPATNRLTIIAEPNGPLEIRGSVEIRNEAGEILFAGNEVWLCRCGNSNTKPICDSSHKRVAFVAD